MQHKGSFCRKIVSVPEYGISLKCVCNVWESISPFGCLCHLELEAVPGCQSAMVVFLYLKSRCHKPIRATDTSLEFQVVFSSNIVDKSEIHNTFPRSVFYVFLINYYIIVLTPYMKLSHTRVFWVESGKFPLYIVTLDSSIYSRCKQYFQKFGNGDQIIFSFDFFCCSISGSSSL